ncbi:MAG TPA: CHC2 zinc finger domain-containing protein, partial [Bacteroidia bacterium]|nr:CHC2 zinc finger domain-containing protein [Bacteroidia bacterium]
MEIPEIKQKLTLAEVIKHYGFKADKQNRINCPFHQDKTPSMQLYWKTHTAYCFSGNCKTHGKSLDVIDFIMHSESSTKAEAINKAKEMITGTASPMEQLTRTAILTKMFTYFKNAVHNSKPAREYIEQRGLDFTKLEIGYNSGQFHHGTRKDETLIKNCLETGLLQDTGLVSRTGAKAFKPFAKFCIAFALRNRAGQVTGLYFRSTVNEQESKHFYLKDRSGLYPEHPKAGTKKLIIAESIIDTATLLQLEEITAEYSLLALYGTNGLTGEHITAIKDLHHLEEIIFFLNGDKAGIEAVKKHSLALQQIKPLVKIYNIEPPEGEDINSLLQGHQPEIFTELLNKKTFIFSTEKPQENKVQLKEKSMEQKEHQEEKQISLDTKNPFKIRYTSGTANYYIQGGISKVLDNMKVTLVVENLQSLLKSRNKVDLYEDRQVEKLCKEVAEKLSLRKDLLEADLYKLTDLLDEFRETELLLNKEGKEQEGETIYPLTTQERGQIETLLKKPKLIQKLGELLGKAGIVGEEKNRIFLLIIAISYKMPETLHALIQGSSGSGKTRLLKQISDCIPQEKVTKLTRISDKVLYN